MFEIIATLAVNVFDLVLQNAGRKRHKERMALRKYEQEQKAKAQTDEAIAKMDSAEDPKV